MYAALYPLVIPPNIGGLNQSADSNRKSSLGHRVTPLDIGGISKIHEFKDEFRTCCRAVRLSVRGYRRFVTTHWESELGFRAYGPPQFGYQGKQFRI